MVALKPYEPDSRRKADRALKTGVVSGFGTLVVEAAKTSMCRATISGKAHSHRFRDFAVVRAVTDIHDGTKTVPAGSKGTVVDVIRGGQGYVVEFMEPRHVVLSALPSELSPV